MELSLSRSSRSRIQIREAITSNKSAVGWRKGEMNSSWGEWKAPVELVWIKVGLEGWHWPWLLRWHAEPLTLSWSPFRGGTQTGLLGSPKNRKHQPESQKAKTMGSGSCLQDFCLGSGEESSPQKRVNSLRNGEDSRRWMKVWIWSA